MNITPLLAVPVTTVPPVPEPAAPGGSEADHGVALEFAVLLAGLLRTPALTPAQPATGASLAAATTDLDADGVVRDDADAADRLLPASGAVTQDDADATPTESLPATGWARLAASTRQLAVPQQSVGTPAASVVPVGADGVTPAVSADGATATSAMVPATTEALVGAAVGLVDDTTPDPLALAAPTAPTLDETLTTSAGGVATVIVRLAEAVATTVRQLLGQETTAAAQTGTSDGTDLPDADTPAAEGHAPVAARAPAMSGGAIDVTGRATLGMASEWGGESSRGHAETHDRTAGADQPVAALRESSGGAFADLARLAGAASTSGTASTPPSAAPAAVVAPPVMAQPDPPPTPATPQTVTVRFDGPGGSESRIRVSVRGDLVHATILTDAQSAPRLEQSLPELQRALADRGFSESRVSVRIMATDGSLPVTTRAEVGSSDASRQRDGQGRQGSERDFAGDERPRGKRHQTGEEAQR